MKTFIMTVLLTLIPLQAFAKCEMLVNQKMRHEYYVECLKISADARKGTNYTTNDDEDFDEVVDQCDTNALWQANVYVCGQNRKIRWDKAQKYNFGD